jgi:hypothetical protein
MLPQWRRVSTIKGMSQLSVADQELAQPSAGSPIGEKGNQQHTTAAALKWVSK